MKKTILITGASSGIGLSTVQLFNREGWNVVATARKPETVDENLRSLERTLWLRLDVTDEKSIADTVSRAKAKFGQIDVVVNNAGYGLVGPFEASQSGQVERQFSTNVFGLMNVVREVLPHFRERRQGTIINVSSMGGLITFPLYSIYHASKFAVEGFSEALQHELKAFNIRVKLIEPGPIKTNFYERSMEIMRKPGLSAYDDYVERAMKNMQASGRSAPGPEAVAITILRAANDKSWRLRYPVNSESILALRKLLPDELFFSLVRSIVLR
jgi:short-subunit dehydrogenase